MIAKHKPLSSLPRGFTLIEMMITVAILAIVGTLAVNGYGGYMRRANRTEATEALLRVQVAQEKFFMQNGRYASTGEIALAAPAGLGMLSDRTPRGLYQLSITPAAPATAYVVTAVPITTAGQAQDLVCQRFTINETGRRQAFDSGGADANAKCWR